MGHWVVEMRIEKLILFKHVYIYLYIDTLTNTVILNIIVSFFLYEYLSSFLLLLRTLPYDTSSLLLTECLFL